METNKGISSYKFPKKERLNSKKLIEELFKKGSSVFVYPFRLLYLPQQTNTSQSTYPPVLFSVSKKHFKKAVDRNLIKRRMREAYRLNKQELISSLPTDAIPTAIAFVYVAKEKIAFDILQKKLKIVWQRLLNN